MQTLLQNLLNGIAAGSIYALIALGYTMVYGILKLINFAHGDVFMLGSFVGYYAGREATKHMGAGEANSPLAAAGSSREHSRTPGRWLQGPGRQRSISRS